MITKATSQDIAIVQEIVYKTIHGIYPNYYPKEVVDYFLNWHNEETILIDLNKGNIFLLALDGLYVGTGTKNENCMSRIYILPEYQGKGLGSMLMDFLEEQISLESDVVYIESSYPAYDIYTKRGYASVEYLKEEVENGRILCWHLMKKEISAHSIV
ncbi:MAG: GNAT family N-acetyltransferase [Candidatus Symbiothrix sp.]|jgi:GNAT superfamily N-acetyltransferase|nr:GNAT family N-acetyltransferase [Candidatus Symbiothrix sp.]